MKPQQGLAQDHGGREPALQVQLRVLFTFVLLAPVTSGQAQTSAHLMYHRGEKDAWLKTGCLVFHWEDSVK